MRSKKKFRRTLLIVCEGSETEPDYFNYLKNIALDKEIWSSISIYPIPEQEEGVTYQPNKRKKRKFNSSTEEDNRFKAYLEDIYETTEAHQLYEHNKSQPSRYVKEAQERMKEEGFNEAWAVFDQDLGVDKDSQQLKKAFNLQNTPVNILGHNCYAQIAFSSRSFEYWVILHFLRIILAYDETECKETINGHDEFFDCGKKDSTHLKNCNGRICLIGYIRAYLYPHFEKKLTLQDLRFFFPKTNFAIENASWLRFQMRKQFPKSPIYELNPYTNVDELVKSILGIKMNYIWADFGEIIARFGEFRHIRVIFLTEQHILFSAKQITINPQSIYCFLKDENGEEEKLSIMETFEEARVKNSFTIILPSIAKNKNLHIKTDNEVLIFGLLLTDK